MTGSEVSFPRLRARTQRFTLGEPRSLSLCADGSRLLFLRSASGEDSRTGLWCVDLPEGEERGVIDPTGDDNLTAAELARRERVRESATGVVSYAADAAGRTAVAIFDGAVHAVDVDSGRLARLPTAGEPFDARVDPTGSHVAYVSGGSLRVIGVDGSGDRQLAGEDSDTVFWGRAEFVAGEEMDRTRGFWWAPDGDRLLAERYDEAPVQTWWIADPAHPDRAPTAVHYPAAGTADADVSLHVVGLDGSQIEVDWDRASFPYLGRVNWAGEQPPLIQVMARDQKTAQIRSIDVISGATTLLAEDTDQTWVELFSGVPIWCQSSLVRIADIAGGRRLLVGDDAVTSPELYVRAVVGSGDAGIVFTASQSDPTSIAVFTWTPGGGVKAVGDPRGVQSAVVSGATVVVATQDLDSTGTSWTIRHGGKALDRGLTSYAVVPPLEPQVRMLTLGERDLRAGLLLPRDHRPGTKLPVVLDPYGGPHAQRVLAARRAWLEPQWLADQGFAVLVVDGRGTPGRSPQWEREIHLDIAGPVLTDQIDALRAAAAVESDLDLERVGIRGWSFGGWLAALAVLRRPDVFAAAVAGAPPTDWALYDTFYTERYLGTPQAQPAAYADCSLLDDAPNLDRPLLLIHGLADDNVVAANTLLLSQRLTEAGRPHTVLPLSGVTHMTPQEAVAENLLLLQVDFLRRALGGPVAQ